jgi:hypothetical protein
LDRAPASLRSVSPQRPRRGKLPAGQLGEPAMIFVEGSAQRDDRPLEVALGQAHAPQRLGSDQRRLRLEPTRQVDKPLRCGGAGREATRADLEQADARDMSRLELRQHCPVLDHQNR